jgi:integrase
VLICSLKVFFTPDGAGTLGLSASGGLIDVLVAICLLWGDRPQTVTEWLDAWIATRVMAGARAKTFEGYRADRRHILRAIGTVRLDRLSAEHVDKLWLAILAAGAGPATYAHVRRTLSGCAQLSGRAQSPGPQPRAGVPAAPLRSPGGGAAERGRRPQGPRRRCKPPERGTLVRGPGSRAAPGGSARSALVGPRPRRGPAHRPRPAATLPWQHGCAASEAAPTCGSDPGRCPERHGGGPVFMSVKSAAGRRVLTLPAPMVESLRRQATTSRSTGHRLNPRRAPSSDHGELGAGYDRGIARKGNSPNGVVVR